MSPPEGVACGELRSKGLEVPSRRGGTDNDECLMSN
jgi:hypothetical protein